MEVGKKILHMVARCENFTFWGKKLWSETVSLINIPDSICDPIVYPHM